MFVTRDQCDARPTITFPAARHHSLSAGIKLYCLVTETENRTSCCYRDIPSFSGVAWEHGFGVVKRPEIINVYRSTTGSITLYSRVDVIALGPVCHSHTIIKSFKKLLIPYIKNNVNFCTRTVIPGHGIIPK